MIEMVKLCSWMWENEYTSEEWRKGVAVNLLREGIRLTQGIMEV